MKLLVTGGAGFIGTNFIRYILKKYPDDVVVNLDALTYCGRDTIGEEQKNYRFIRGSVCDEQLVEELFRKEKFDMVIHFAAETHVDRSLMGTRDFLNTNIMGTQVLLDASLKYEVGRYHQVSTDEVYGSLPLDDRTALFQENSVICPSSPYSVSKASADLLVLSYYQSFQMPVTISRCSNNYGPWQYPEKLIPLTISRALENKKIPVYGTGRNVRDWLYVEDHCTAIDRIVHDGRIGEVYNIGGNNERSNLELVKLILNTLDRPEDLIQFTKDRKGHDLRYAIDSTKIRTELGWEPQHDFQNGIRKTIQWYLEHQKWLEEAMDEEYRSYFWKQYHMD